MEIVSIQQLNRDAIPSYDSLFQDVWNNFVKYDSKYGKDDYRSIFYGTYSETLLWALVQLEIFSNHIPKPIIKNRFDNLKPSSLAQVLLQYDTINRQAFVVVTMALVEDFINAICQELFRISFTNYSKAIENLCNKIFPNDLTKFHGLYSLYLIRNSLHNNGSVKILKNDFDLHLEGRKYEFRRGQQITFAGWDNLPIIVRHLLNIITEIIENKNIQSIPKIKHTNALESDTGALLNRGDNVSNI